MYQIVLSLKNYSLTLKQLTAFAEEYYGVIVVDPLIKDVKLQFEFKKNLEEFKVILDLTYKLPAEQE